MKYLNEDNVLAVIREMNGRTTFRKRFPFSTDAEPETALDRIADEAINLKRDKYILDVFCDSF